METMPKAVLKVAAGDCVYPVIFNKPAALSSLISRYWRIVIISNPTVYGLHGQAFTRKYLSDARDVVSLVIGDGEKYKNQKTINNIFDHLLDLRLGRKDLIIALGGGVVGDAAGFAAATYMRGIDFIQAPTTLLAMVDSAIGGKVGINHPRGKNLIGAFHQPQAVIIDSVWLNTLGQHYIIDGLAEIIKTGFLTSPDFLAKTIDILDRVKEVKTEDLLPLIREAVKFKADVVAQDHRDRNVRAILNLGHTFAHAIEKTEYYHRYRHGEAVLAGLCGMLSLSHACGHMTKAKCDNFVTLLAPALRHLKKLNHDIRDYLSPLTVDKKIEGGCVNFVLLKDIGRTVIRPVKSEKLVRKAFEFMIETVNGYAGRRKA